MYYGYNNIGDFIIFSNIFLQVRRVQEAVPALRDRPSPVQENVRWLYGAQRPDERLRPVSRRPSHSTPSVDSPRAAWHTVRRHHRNIMSSSSSSPPPHPFLIYRIRQPVHPFSARPVCTKTPLVHRCRPRDDNIILTYKVLTAGVRPTYFRCCFLLLLLLSLLLSSLLLFMYYCYYYIGSSRSVYYII